MKNFFCIALAVFVLPVYSFALKIHGDIDGNGKLELTDVIKILQSISDSDSNYPVHVQDIEELRESVLIESDVPVTVRDGTRLYVNVYRPNSPGTYPVIMSFTSYGKDTSPDKYPPVLDLWKEPEYDLGTFEVSPWTTWEGSNPAFWVPQRYVVIHVDVRGYFSSEGDAGVLSEQDAKDFYDVIEWAGVMDWSNGNVGLTGVSYLAISQWVAAGTNPPHLKAVNPWEGQTHSFREVMYHGGIPETAFSKYWLERVNSLANKPPLPPWSLFQMGHKNPQLMKQSMPDQSIPLGLVMVPALICASWSDQGLHTRGSFEAYKKISSEHKWLFNHGRPKWSTYYSEEALEYQLKFFDHFLKGVDNGMDEMKSVRLEVRETLKEYEVRYEDSWPIPRTEYRRLYLNASSGTLQEDLPSQMTAVQYAPLTEAASFTFTFEQDTELTGNMKLRLWVSTSDGSDMDLFVGVKKLNVQDEEVTFYAKTGYNLGPVSMGWLRVSERELDEEKSTSWQPVLTHNNAQPISPNETVSVDIEILPSSTLFRAGESLKVVVQGADLFEHPFLAHEYSDQINVGNHTIYSGAEYDSYLLIPVVPSEDTSP